MNNATTLVSTHPATSRIRVATNASVAIAAAVPADIATTASIPAQAIFITAAKISTSTAPLHGRRPIDSTIPTAVRTLVAASI